MAELKEREVNQSRVLDVLNKRGMIVDNQLVIKMETDRDWKDRNRNCERDRRYRDRNDDYRSERRSERKYSVPRERSNRSRSRHRERHRRSRSLSKEKYALSPKSPRRVERRYRSKSPEETVSTQDLKIV